MHSQSQFDCPQVFDTIVFRRGMRATVIVFPLWLLPLDRQFGEAGWKWVPANSDLDPPSPFLCVLAFSLGFAEQLILSLFC